MYLIKTFEKIPKYVIVSTFIRDSRASKYIFCYRSFVTCLQILKEDKISVLSLYYKSTIGIYGKTLNNLYNRSVQIFSTDPVSKIARIEN